MQFFIFDVFLQSPPPTTALDSYTDWACNLIDRTTYFIPSSPITLGDLADQIGDSLPFVGGRLTYMVILDISRVISVVVFWKIFKSIPGKFS
ncbi:hypothetical protein [Cyanothece sp. BG0011]|uniref:hypothetical protein n=1 Tax=Cyanothece sp. BG0011 TaxID=2082950 RepID=UPI000D1FD17C|nr:hypothetical protein [Cyanothece sp. BG0011]